MSEPRDSASRYGADGMCDETGVVFSLLFGWNKGGSNFILNGDSG